MKNLFIASCAIFTILLLIFTSCENDIVQDFDNIESQSKRDHENSDDLDLNTISPVLNANNDEINIIKPEDENTLELAEADLMRDDVETTEVSSLHLDCLPDSKFIVRATYNDQTNSISFEYFDNSANQSTEAPVAINWLINDGRRAFPQAEVGPSAENTDFAFDIEYKVSLSIAFDDNTTFEDEFCLNIDRDNPTAFNVCSEHETFESCNENGRGPSKKELVVVDIIM